MNREIEFRGKRVDNSEWVYGYYVNKAEHKHQIVTNKDVFPVLVHSETVGQFAGLQDKNGTDIYEGDIIRQTNFNGEEYTAIYKVVYDMYGFCLKMLSGNKKAMSIDGFSAFGYTDGNRLRKGVVIGNIHDNKDLIKKI